MGFFSRQSPNPLQNPVIAKPTISIVPKNSEKDQLLLLGSDGIFDVFENSEDLAHYALNRFQVFFIWFMKLNYLLIENFVLDIIFSRYPKYDLIQLLK